MIELPSLLTDLTNSSNEFVLFIGALSLRLTSSCRFSHMPLSTPNVDCAMQCLPALLAAVVVCSLYEDCYAVTCDSVSARVNTDGVVCAVLTLLVPVLRLVLQKAVYTVRTTSVCERPQMAVGS